MPQGFPIARLLISMFDGSLHLDLVGLWISWWAELKLLYRRRIPTLYDQTPNGFKMAKKNHILYAKQRYSVLLLYISIYSVL